MAGPPTPFRFTQVAAFPGVNGQPGAPGRDGVNGVNGVSGQSAFTTLTGGFSMPAVGANIGVTVVDSTTLLVGHKVAVAGAGLLLVVARGTGSATLQNPTDVSGNVAPGTAVPSGGVVVLAGAPGAPGPAPPGTGVVLVSSGTAATLPASTAVGQAPVSNGTQFFGEGHHRYFNVKTYGAKGDGVTDDHAAIMACVTAAHTAKGIIYFPQGTYLVNSEITLVGFASNPWHFKGETSGSLGAGMGPRIVAGTAMRSVIAHTNQFSTFDTLFIDGNNLAKYGFLELGTSYTKYRDVTVQLCIIDGIARAAFRLQPTLTITAGGGNTSPTPTVSQRDPLAYADPGSAANHDYHLKVTGTGTGFLVSQDNGVTYTSIAVPIAQGGVSEIVTAVSEPAAYGPDSGITVHWPVGTYVDNNTYTVHVVAQSGDLANNDNNIYERCYINNNGTVYLNAGYSVSLSVTTAAVADIVTVNAASQVATFSGGTLDLFAAGVRTGSMLHVNGVHVTVASVLTSKKLAFQYVWLFPVSRIPTYSGTNWALHVGEGCHEASGSDQSLAHFIDCGFYNNAVGCTLGGLYGAQLDNCNFTANGIAGVIAGSGVNQIVSGLYLVKPYFEGGGPSVFADAGCIGLTIDEASGAFTLDGNPSCAITYSHTGRFFGTAAASAMSIPLGTVQYQPSDISTPLNAGDTWPLPDFSAGFGSGNYSLMVMHPASSFTTGPILPTTNVTVGCVAYYQNYEASTHECTLTDRTIGGNVGLGAACRTWPPGCIIGFIYTLHGWELFSIVYPSSYAAEGGRDGTYAGAFAKLVTPNPGTVAQFAVGAASSLSLFQCYFVDVIATDTTGANVGAWLGYRLLFDTNGNQVGSTTVDQITGNNSGAPPSGWAPSFSASAGTLTLSFTAASATVLVRAAVREMRFSSLVTS